MKEGKYDKYFISQTPPNPLHPESRNKDSYLPWVNYPISIEDEVYGKVKGAFWFSPNIVLRPNTETMEETPGNRPHLHDFDEYLFFGGLNPDNLADLGGEVEFWMGGEQHIITKSTAVFIPRGVYHCPLYMRKVDRPFLFMGIANTLKYSHMQYSKDKKYADYKFFDEIAEVSLGGKKYQITKTYAEYLSWLIEKNQENLP
jgi:hypothetical protein